MNAPIRELIIDNFAGGGGASIGLERALGRVDIAINHDPRAVAMHKANHPETYHYVQNINTVDPVDVAAGRPVGLAWFSPDCTHHSKAAGRRPRSQRIRDLAWVVVHWAQRVQPRLICLENVEEFRDWGPLLENGQPCPERKGETFREWLGQLRRAGYRCEYRELRACDYGAPTIRKRLFLIARRDGRPIVWPEPTHGPGRLPYRTAAECIDWSLPCPSIFGRKKPLAPATMRRIARGLRKYVLESASPFLVPTKHVGPSNSHNVRAYSLDQPAVTLTTQADLALVAPYLTKFNQNSIGQELQSPLDTVMAGAPRFALVAPHLLVNTTGHSGSAADQPLSTVTTGGHHGLVAAWMAQHNTGSIGHEVTDPVSTILSAGVHQQLCTSHLAVLRNNQDGRSVEEPVPTLTASGTHVAEVRAFLQAYYSTDQDARLDAPLPTITTRDRFGVVVCYQLVDIGMRMLSPRELFRAQGFPDDYVIDPVYEGSPLTKTAQIRCCGNSVCPQVAEAIVRANYVPGELPVRRSRKRLAVGQGVLL